MVTDIRLPGLDGLELVHLVKALAPRVAVRLLTLHDGDEYPCGMVEQSAQADDRTGPVRRYLRGAAGEPTPSAAVARRLPWLVRGGEGRGRAADTLSGSSWACWREG